MADTLRPRRAVLIALAVLLVGIAAAFSRTTPGPRPGPEEPREAGEPPARPIKIFAQKDVKDSKDKDFFDKKEFDKKDSFDKMKDSPPARLPPFDARTPAKDLVPAAPAAKRAAVYTGDDLSRVPELALEGPPEGKPDREGWRSHLTRALGVALHLNAREEDGYVKALIKHRADLAGLPFVLGGACRTRGHRVLAFKEAVAKVHAMTRPEEIAAAYATWRSEAERNIADLGRDKVEITGRAQMDAVLQVMGPRTEAFSRASVKYLAATPRADATRELARLAVFSSHAETRADAIQALSVRRERDIEPVLAEALGYPWPGVAKNAAEAIVKLELKSLLPRLVDMLEAPDPRGPQAGEGEKAAPFARELVRVNHHRGCVLCHPPVDPDRGPFEPLSAEVPFPSDALSNPASGYGRSGNNLLVRIDVTYLRQDFSVMQDVDDAAPWPASQRFDFLVRKRELTAAEADELRTRLEKREPGLLSPYQKAAVTALRELTRRDFEAKAEPWRKFLKLAEAR